MGSCLLQTQPLGTIPFHLRPVIHPCNVAPTGWVGAGQHSWAGSRGARKSRGVAHQQPLALPCLWGACDFVHVDGFGANFAPLEQDPGASTHSAEAAISVRIPIQKPKCSANAFFSVRVGTNGSFDSLRARRHADAGRHAGACMLHLWMAHELPCSFCLDWMNNRPAPG